MSYFSDSSLRFVRRRARHNGRAPSVGGGCWTPPVPAPRWFRDSEFAAIRPPVRRQNSTLGIAPVRAGG